MTQAQNSSTPTLLTVRQLSDKHPAFLQSSIRNFLFFANDRKTSKGLIKGNGFTAAVVRLGKKILIDESKFFEWVDAQNTAGE